MNHRRRKPRGYALTFKVTPATAMFAEELEQLARLTALRPDLRMVVGCSDSGWHFNWITGVISIDGEKMTGESPDYNRGLVLHESAHAAITRLEGIVPAELLQDRRLFALLNVVEDCRIETWMQKRFPGCRPWVREYNDKLFSPVLENDGNLPLVGQFLNGILTRWWYGQAAEPMADEVRQAVEAIWPVIQQILLALPPSPENLRGISDRYAQSRVAHSYAEADQSLPPGEYEMAVRLAQYDMWCRVHEDILPVYRRLLPPGQTVSLPLKLYLSRLSTAMPDRRMSGFPFSSRFPSVTLHVSSGSGEEPETALPSNGYDAYLRSWQEQYPVIEHTAENLLRLFRPSGRTRLREGCPSGSRLDLRMAMRFEADPRLYDRLWSRPLVPQRIDPHFTLVIDRSGSMEGEKIQQAFKGIVLLCEVCHRVGLPLNIFSFASQAESLLDHGEKLSAGVRARLGALTDSADGDTNLAGALSLVTENLKAAPFRDRFVFVVSRLPCPEIAFVRGNHEDEAWLAFALPWRKLGRPLHALHGQVFTRGPMAIVGFPCSMGDEHAFLGSRAPLPIESGEWLPEVLLKGGRAARTLWLMHEPPIGTPLTTCGSIVEGNPDWVAAIDRFSLWLAIVGHDHITPIRSNC